MADSGRFSTTPPAKETTGAAAPRHDAPAMLLHWVTALLVITLFLLAETWDFVPRGLPLHHGMQSLHISLGLTLAGVFLLRLVWRVTGARRLPAALGGVPGIAASVMHVALYGLIAVQLVLGFLFRWREGPIGFFGLFAIPSPIAIGHATGYLAASLHDYVGWLIVILAGGHAAVALAHHYLLRDGVLRRMLPRFANR
jgi:cytochrome b561